LQAYNLNTLTEVQNNTLKDLADLGLVKLQQVRLRPFVIFFLLPNIKRKKTLLKL